MKVNMATTLFLMLSISCLALQTQLSAQVFVQQSVFGSGGGEISNDTYRALGTAGQSVIGMSNNDVNGSSSGFWSLPNGFVVSVEQTDISIPKEFRLDQNYPNPFNPSTTITFALPKRTKVTLKLFDILGREVVTLMKEELEPGVHKVLFEAEGMASGIYYYSIQTKEFKQARRLTLLK